MVVCCRRRCWICPPLGLLNVHASLLPAWRGASPIQRAILNGDAVSGVTIMRVVLALDAGAMLARVEVPIEPDDTTGSLEQRLAVSGALLLREVVDRLGRGETVIEEPQDDALATLAPKIEKQEGLIDWTRPAHALDCHVRGMQPWPGAFTFVDGQRLDGARGDSRRRAAGRRRRPWRRRRLRRRRHRPCVRAGHDVARRARAA